MNKEKKSGGIFVALFAVVAIVAVGVAVWGWLIVFTMKGQNAKAAQQKQMMASMPAPTVDAVVVKEKPVIATEKFIARVEPIESVNVVARVEGVIEKVHFSEGSMVKRGDLLFTIEQDRYSAELQVAKASLVQAEAALKQADKYYKRLKDADKRSVSQADLDNAESTLLQAKAQIKLAEANIAVAQLNMDYTKITAPISGKIGRNFFTVGNTVSPNSGMLARIIQLDPIRVIFSTTDKSYTKAMNLQKQGKVSEMVSSLKLPDGTDYTAQGKWDFVDNEMDSTTGTIAVRTLFNNPDKVLIPGGHVYIHISPKDAKMNPVVPQSALLNDNKGYYVYAVDNEGTVAVKRIKIIKNSEGLVTIKSGVKAGEQVVVQGLQKVAPGAKVNINLINLLPEGENE